jgi:hypothetical protein
MMTPQDLKEIRTLFDNWLKEAQTAQQPPRQLLMQSIAKAAVEKAIRRKGK